MHPPQPQPAAWSSIFFFLLLAAIIFLPLIHPIYLRFVPEQYHRFYPWDANWKKLIIAAVLSASYFVYLLHLSVPLAQSMFLFSLHSFIALFALLFALFLICTGLPMIQLPSTVIEGQSSFITLIVLVMKNILFLIIGIVLCNCIGTLAASVLFFPAFLSQNASRLNHRPTQHCLIIFFIIMIGNSGGVLSPLGDPPLYMGYTNGVRFLFTFEHLYPIFLVVNGYLLLLFGIIDLINAILKRSAEKRGTDHPASINEMELVEPFVAAVQHDVSLSTIEYSCRGIYHLPFLILVLALVIFKGLNFPVVWRVYVQEILLIVVTLACLLMDMIVHRLTPGQWYSQNYFTRLEPVVEVLVIFIGLLFTMSSPIAILTNFHIHLGPKLLFLVSGVFGAFLDNAAVYISFAANAAARYKITIDQLSTDEYGSTVGFLHVFFRDHPKDALTTIRALSAGSVLMGGCTLIGNAPNIVIALMATRFTYRRSNTIKHVEQIGLLREMFVACVVLIPIFVFVAFFML